MLNLRSTGDLVVMGKDIPGATNVTLETEDHYAVATSVGLVPRAVRLLPRGRHARDGRPDRHLGGGRSRERVRPRGRAGRQRAGRRRHGRGLRPEPGHRRASGRHPEATFAIGPDAAFGPFEADTTQRYEFRVTSPRAGSRPVSYFHRPFATDDALVYLRTLPTTGLPGALLGQLPFDDAHSVVVVYLARGAMLAGRDSLLLDGEEIATDVIAAADDTTIALFLYDDQKDQMNGGSTATFEAFPFLAGLDRFIEADAARTLPLSFNGVSLDVPRRPSGTDGASIVVFD
jgi:hypothetical protein